jgi:hypothetical protein
VSKPSSNNSHGPIPVKDANHADTKSARISRREFGLDAAVAATAAAAFSLSPPSLLTRRRDLDNISPTIPAGEQESAKAKLTPEQSRDVEAKLANIIGKYGERLSEEQREHLRRILAYNETLLAPIRAFALQNGDPPVTVSKLSSGENIE